MKPPPTIRRVHNQAGVALVVTLAILVLMMGLTVALLLTASNERRSAALYKSSQGLRELADTSVNLVMAQIQEATNATADLPPAQRQTWASQPGMIRTYGAGPNAVNSYKLYSWANPTVAGDADDAVPNDWFDSPAIFTDLNEPLPNSEAPTDEAAFRYPVAYPPPTGPQAPAGYSINANAPLATGPGFQNPVPMPVQWLYVLQDGTLQYPTPGTGNTATITGASADNPIVARVAFWTDDETSKVNLNTAAGGEYWAPPVQKTERQYINSIWQPLRWEFQRYPGHPARTDLLALFPDLRIEGDPWYSVRPHARIWDLIPRITDSGYTVTNASQATIANEETGVAYDMERLFASVGEVQFAPEGEAGGRRNNFEEGTLEDWKERIEQMQFLVTTSSRAPETTAYGTPRVSLWPISTMANRRTAFDRLIAFCATIRNTNSVNNPQPYYFVRSTPENWDGAGGDIAANQDMFDYLEALSSVNRIPGFAGTGLVTKYTLAGRDQILTQMFDYIRIVNRLERQLGNLNTSFSGLPQIIPPVVRSVNGQETRGFGRFPTINQIAIHFICTADANSPLSSTDENLSLRQTTDIATYTPLLPGQRNIMALAYLEVAMPTVGFPQASYPQIRFTVRGLDALTLDGEPLGFPATADLVARPGDVAATANINSGYGGGVMKYLVFLSTGGGGANRGSTLAPAGRNGFPDGTNRYPLASQSVRVSGATMDLSAADVEVDVTWPSAATTPIHTVDIPIEARTLAVPSLPSEDNRWVFDQIGWDGSGSTEVNPDGSTGRLPSSNHGQSVLGWERTRLFLPDVDTVTATATVHGDYRLSMVRPTDPSHWGTVSQSPTTPNFAHRLHTTSGGNIIPESSTEPGVHGVLPLPNHLQALRPAIPFHSHLESLGLANTLTYGDFNNGIPPTADGPYINAPDEVGGFATGLFWDNSMPANFGQISNAAIFNTPNRKIASAISFGSLPSAVVQGRPWQNLLFRPAPGVDHPGKAGFAIDGTPNPSAPADHHWLDFFWMPVVEPYAISETFSTAGKINMNHRIAPFSYINRTTGLDAVLGSGGVTAVPSSSAFYPGGNYRKSNGNNNFGQYIGFESLFDVNVQQTLNGFRARMNANNLFRAASEICELPIVPAAPAATYGSLLNGSWWINYRLTGDNTREATYNDIYPRLTTRSNTFTVHYRVQTLKKRTEGEQDEWDEDNDTVVSELRGNTLIERYLDPNAIYPNYATNFATAESMDALYRFRILQRADFTP